MRCTSKCQKSPRNTLNLSDRLQGLDLTAESAACYSASESSETSCIFYDCHEYRENIDSPAPPDSKSIHDPELHDPTHNDSKSDTDEILSASTANDGTQPSAFTEKPFKEQQVKIPKIWKPNWRIGELGNYKRDLAAEKLQTVLAQQELAKLEGLISDFTLPFLRG